MSGKRKGQCLISDMFKTRKLEDCSSLELTNEPVTSIQLPSGSSSSETKHETFNPNYIGLYLNKRIQDEEKVKLVHAFWPHLQVSCHRKVSKTKTEISIFMVQ